MGPQPAGCGILKNLEKMSVRNKLQWGRSLQAAEFLSEFPKGRNSIRFNGAAACRLRNFRKKFRPDAISIQLQWGRSLQAAEFRYEAFSTVSSFSASMGPQPAGCGIEREKAKVLQLQKLQWGRSLQAAELIAPRLTLPTLGLLQWGRSLQAAELNSASAGMGQETPLQWGRSLQAAELRTI